MKENKPKQEIHKEPIVKFVKRANAWVTTSFEHGKQIQTWNTDKPKDTHSLLNNKA